MATDWGTPTDQVTVLQAVVTRLQSQIAKLHGDNLCFLSMDPEPIGEQRQNLYATVAPMGGRFDDAISDGSGSVNELSGVVVTVWSGMRLDRADADALMMTDAARGLLTLKQQILKALSGYALLDHSGNKILVRPMRPINAGHPQRESEAKGSFSLSFSTDFIWNLS